MKILPARFQQKTQSPVVDLDAIVAERIPFRFHGKTHYLEPFDVRQFLKYVAAQAELENLMKAEAITPQELAVRFHAVISSVCKSVTIADIEKAQQVQVAALMQLIVDQVTGQVDLGDGKKKRTKVDLYAIAPRSSQGNAP